MQSSVGGQTSEEEPEKKPAVWLNVENDGSVQFLLQNFPKSASSLNSLKIKGLEDRKIDLSAIKTYVDGIREYAPELKTILLQPKNEVVYEQIVSLMDTLKGEGFINLGLSPF